MSPRRTHPKSRKKSEDAEQPFSSDLPVPAPPGWNVRKIQPASARKLYRCPGCNQEIRPGTGHVVAWRTDGEHERRHWHTSCWQRAKGRI